ncbi:MULTISPECIES: hypothetical protein [unclassified Meiothermus]|uniref:hypothetical protein n=1 Tax=unclassified Meiothermus TaxID=370471 RepID=UPI000D7C1F2F|nr:MULTISPECIES: hypothetical protein [unclassified Meiothermus]PZA06516.1 hypothetical protein DNA98_13100 [Meiothermus sp. Pnk-1]RYM37190.1 hypothetical protein EWH23_06860 [Meiothermus sp. PNK-Is4]
MQPRFFIALGIGAALFALSLATFRWNTGGFVLSAVIGGIGAYLFYRWNGGLERSYMNPAARERIAMQTAWRKGGKLSAAEFSEAVGLPEDLARETLEALAERGLCRKEGSVYLFYPKGA